MTTSIDDLRAWVEAALRPEAEEDPVPLWDALNAAVETAPDLPELRRLRIRLARAAYEVHIEHTDLLALRRLVPDDRETALDLAITQHEHAAQLVAVAMSDTDANDANDASSEAAHSALRAQSVAWLVELCEQYRADAAFSARLLERWRAANLYQPWTHLRLALQAAAAHRSDRQLLRALAAAWADLADQVPADYDPESNKVPAGFLVAMGGQLRDPFSSARAIACYTELLQAEPGDAPALRARAELHDALCDFEAAAADFDAAAAAFERIAASVTPEERALLDSGRGDESDPALANLLERLSAPAYVDAARSQAALCRGGRAAQQAAGLDALEQALAKLKEPPPAPRSNRPEAEEFFAQMRQQRQQLLEQLEPQLSAVAQNMPPSQPDAARVAQMRATAQTVAAKLVKAVPTEPQEMLPIQPTQFEGDWLAQFEPFCSVLNAAGWRDLGWLEWPKYRATIGRQCVSSQWSDDASGAVAIAFAMSGRLHIDIETELADGRQIVSSVSRGANFLTHGGELDTWFVERSLPLADICALHCAYVAWAAGPTEPRRMHTLPDLMAMQRRGAALKLRYRLEHGIGHYETRGMNSDYPEIFGPMVQAAFREQLDPLRARLSALLAGW